MNSTMTKICFLDMNFRLRTDWNDIKKSTFDIALESTWKEKMNKGIFRYKLNALKTKNLNGNFQFLAQLNSDRATKKRTPQRLYSIKQPFDKNEFNFTQINKNEFMFQVSYNEQESRCEINDNYIAVNVSPLEFGHCLLLPSLHSCLPQLLTLRSINYAINTLLSSHNPAFRIGFNSLCAYATVNHLHLHAYYLNQPMLLETIEVNHLSGNCYILDRFPSKGYVFEITSLEDFPTVTRDIHLLIELLIENDFAHNMYITRGLSFKRAKFSEETTERDSVRIYVWARTHSEKIKILDEFNPAVCELFGHLLIKTEGAYSQCSEEYAAEILKRITESPFTSTLEKIRLLFKNNDQ